MSIRVGVGYDVHAFEPNCRLMLGGVSVHFHYGLAGHSDADVVIRTIVDALLGSGQYVKCCVKDLAPAWLKMGLAS